jgi:hypothetical protein
MNHNFNEVIEKVFELPMEEKLELIDILEHHIDEGKRDEIAENYKKSIEEYKSGELNFSSDIGSLKTML